MGRSLKETRLPEESPDYAMRSSNKQPGALGTNTEASIEELSRVSMASRGPLTAGDGDKVSSLVDRSKERHPRPGRWKQSVSTDGTQI